MGLGGGCGQPQFGNCDEVTAEISKAHRKRDFRVPQGVCRVCNQPVLAVVLVILSKALHGCLCVELLPVRLIETAS